MKQALILAGGKGTRLGELTKDTPKPLLKFDGENCTLSILINKCLKEEFDNIIILAGYLPKMMKEFHDSFNEREKSKIKVLYEKELLGTAGAINNASMYLSDKFLVLNGDTLLNFNFGNFFESSDINNRDAFIAIKEASNVSDRFGLIKLNEDYIEAFDEKKSSFENSKYYINLGCYILTKELFKLQEPGRKFSLEFDLFPSLAKKKKIGYSIYQQDFIDIGTPESYSIAKEFNNDS